MEKVSAVEMRSCATCKFSGIHRPPPPEIGKIRVCKRFPPVMTMLMTENGPAGVCNFPIVTDEIWCFEYAPEGAANS
jgi:hypothetical protein